jgi:hypothetical protein
MSSLVALLAAVVVLGLAALALAGPKEANAAADSARWVAVGLGSVAALAQVAALYSLVCMFSLGDPDSDTYRGYLGFLPYTSIGAGVAGLWASVRLGTHHPSEGVGFFIALLFSIGGLGLGVIETLLYFFARSLGHVSGPF